MGARSGISGSLQTFVNDSSSGIRPRSELRPPRFSRPHQSCEICRVLAMRMRVFSPQEIFRRKLYILEPTGCIAVDCSKQFSCTPIANSRPSMKRAVTFRLDPDLLTAARNCAKEENRTLTNFIETLLKQHIAKDRSGISGRQRKKSSSAVSIGSSDD